MATEHQTDAQIEYLRSLQHAPPHPLNKGEPPSEADHGDEHQPPPSRQRSDSGQA